MIRLVLRSTYNIDWRQTTKRKRIFSLQSFCLFVFFESAKRLHQVWSLYEKKIFIAIILLIRFHWISKTFASTSIVIWKFFFPLQTFCLFVSIESTKRLHRLWSLYEKKIFIAIILLIRWKWISKTFASILIDM